MLRRRRRSPARRRRPGRAHGLLARPRAPPRPAPRRPLPPRSLRALPRLARERLLLALPLHPRRHPRQRIPGRALPGLPGGLDPLEIALHAGLPAPDPLAPPAADPASPLGSLETIGRALRLVREAASFEDGLRRALAAAGDPVANASIAGAFLEIRFFPGEDTLQEAIARLADPENRPLGLTLLRVCLSPVARSRDPFPERRLAFAESLGLALGAPARRPAPR